MKTYVGYRVGDSELEVFKSDREPTRESHGDKYAAVIGPFKTARGARFMRDHGRGNPHCRCVAEAERLGAKYA